MSDVTGRRRLVQTVGYPRIGRDREVKRALEGYWKGQPTVIHVYKRAAALPDRCVARELARWRGFDRLLPLRGGRAVPAKNVLVGTLMEKGALRVGTHR